MLQEPFAQLPPVLKKKLCAGFPELQGSSSNVLLRLGKKERVVVSVGNVGREQLDWHCPDVSLGIPTFLYIPKPSLLSDSAVLPGMRGHREGKPGY